jgi:hypothetical protein
VEGFKAFRGIMVIDLPLLDDRLVIEGDWLYMPDPDCWYCQGASYCAEFCHVAKVE